MNAHGSPRTRARARARGATVVIALALGSAGCLLLRDVDALTRGADAGVANETDADAGDAGPSTLADGALDALAEIDAEAGATCPGTAGPPGVRVGPYCIDATEVTVKHYRAFLAAKAGDVTGQPASCAWNTTFRPLTGVPGTDADDLPMAYVDLCDAVAYCAWAGKHLCGAIDGAALTTSDVANAARSEWFRACSRNDDGLHPYPYGEGEPLRCNGAARDAGVARVASLTGCEGGYAGLFDLAGNVREWEDACDEPRSGNAAERTCLTRGGAFYDIESTLACDNRQTYAVTEQNVGVGFRCCAR